MDTEARIVAGVIAFSLLPLLLAACRTRNTKWVIAAALLCVAGPIAYVQQVRRVRPRLFNVKEPIVSDRPIEVSEDGYVSSRSCQACHQHRYATWHASYHRTMTQLATPETVVGDFDGVELHHDGRMVRLERRGAEFWVEMDDLGGTVGEGLVPRVWRRVVMTTGSHHYQAYWLPSGHTRRVDIMPFIYHIEEQRWMPRLSAFMAPPNLRERMHMGRWNTTCVDCHATHGKPRLTGPSTIDTTVAQFGIACEACHGPAEQHVRVNHDPLRRYRLHLSGEPDPTIVHPGRLSPIRSSQVCGQCHFASKNMSNKQMRSWAERGYAYRPGDDLFETRNGPAHGPTKTWSDGMIRVSGREYNGLLETPCYKHEDPQKGILSCLSCHSMHQQKEDPRPQKEWANDQLKVGMDGNQACLQCHDSFRDRIQDHTRHAPNSSGSLCYNCHMPHTTYGLLKAIRSHQIDSPTVDASLRTGRPNACNLCHLDKTLDWAAGTLEKWYGTPKPELTEDEKTVPASLLWILRGDAGQRALIAWSMGWEPAREISGPQWRGRFLAELLADPYDAVRFVAYRALRAQPGFGDFEYDFMGAAQERVAARTRAMRIWARTYQAAANRTRLEDLIDRPGEFSESEMLALINRLLKERDNRRVLLGE